MKLDQYPHVASQWHLSRNAELAPESVRAKATTKHWWQCDKGHEWEATPKNRTQYGSGCPFCFRASRGSNSLDITHPKLAAEWHPTKNDHLKFGPSDIRRGSNEVVWWLCDKGHEWKQPIISRTRRGRGCRTCAGSLGLGGENSLAITHPDLAQEWASGNDKTPEGVSSGSSYMADWLCSKGHSYTATVNNRKNGRGCPYCSNFKVLAGFNDLATTHPEVAASLSSKNPVSATSFTHGSSQYALWECKHGHEWLTKVCTRIKSGCPLCSRAYSQAERELADWVKGLGVQALRNDRSLLGGKELDIYLPDCGLAIEYNGIYWHSEKFLDKQAHLEKFQLCADKGVQLLQVWEDDWHSKSELVKAVILHKLGLSMQERIPARKTQPALISYDEAASFLECHHIQGKANGSHYVALKRDGLTVAVMVLKRIKQGEYLISRYATSAIVQGGFTKLMRYGQEISSAVKLVTFSDNTISDGSLYVNNGFTLDGELKPDYSYAVQSKRVHKFNYRLKRFRTDGALQYEPGLSESQLAALNQLHRIWDAGKKRWVKTFPKQ